MAGPIGIDWSTVRGLGERPDSEIAAELGVRKQAVQYVRAKCGIPAAQRVVPPKPARALPPRVRLAIDWASVDLRRPTAELVAELGCSPTRIFDERRKRGVRLPRTGRKMAPRVAAARDAVRALVAAGMPRRAALVKVAEARGVPLTTVRHSVRVRERRTA